jgi:hypothetical protein
MSAMKRSPVHNEPEVGVGWSITRVEGHLKAAEKDELVCVCESTLRRAISSSNPHAEIRTSPIQRIWICDYRHPDELPVVG